MNLTRSHRTTRECLLVLALLILAVGASPVFAAGDITGVWRATMDFDGNEMHATLSFAKKADGTYAGKWGSSELANVKFDGEKLTFDRTMQMGDQDFTQNFTGTLKDGKLSGTMGNDQFESSITAVPKKAKCPAVGQWDIKFNVMDRDITARLVVSEKPDGALEGKWTEEMGEHKVSSIKFQDGKLTLTRQSKIGEGGMDMEFESTYTATVKGNELIGTLESEMGDWQADGQRFGAPLIGTWDLTNDTEMGPMKGMLVIDPDLTGTYEFFGNDTPIRDLKLEGNKVTFVVEMGFGGQGFRLDFDGKVDGKTLSGKMNSEMGASDVTGKKLEAAAAPAASIVGTWELTSESPMGSRTNTLKINPDMTGTYSLRDNETPISDLKVEGDQVTFKVALSFNDQEFTIEFKAKLAGDTLNGETITQRGNRPFTGKRVN